MRIAVISDTHFGEPSLDFVGAEVLVYETGRGVRSVSIRTADVYPVEEPLAAGWSRTGNLL